jgi:hypothetical protein
MFNRIIAATVLAVPMAMAAEPTGLHQFCETLPHEITRNTGWDAGCDSRSYTWKNQDGVEAATVEATTDDKVEGNISHRFTLKSGWSRWILEMNPDVKRPADLSAYKTMVLSVKSESAKNFDSFSVMVGDAKNQYEAQLSSIGFKPDGAWHQCTIDLSAVAKAGVDLKQVTSLLMIGWGGGVSEGDQFWLDDVRLK